MNTTVKSFITACVLVGIGYAAWSGWVNIQEKVNLVAIAAEPTEHWIRVDEVTIADAQPGTDPLAHLSFQVLKTAEFRIRSEPRNVDTGEVLCVGRSVTVIFEPIVFNNTAKLSSLAGLKDCEFPPGNYALSLTWDVTDAETHIRLKPLTQEKSFRVLEAVGGL